MAPYLEGYLWPDVHNALAYKIRLQLELDLLRRWSRPFAHPWMPEVSYA